jgi:hypothetical protein
VTGLHGIVHGGPNPVVGATVTLYRTSTVASPTSGNNWGYGQPGVSIGSTTTGAGGDFSFTGDETNCTAGQQAYVVAAGGKTGSQSAANPAAVLMAALGACGSGLTNATPVVIDEPTTIAAAYALSGFMTVTGTGSSTAVNISAPANNNATSAACATNGSKQTTGCAASGLAHAFLNASTLVNSQTGVANATVTTNNSAVVATVPQALINTLANSVEACVNSSGSSSSACTTVLGYPSNSTALISNPPTITNTLQALLYLAQYPVEAANPTLAATTPTNTGIQPSAATTAFFNVANNNAYYQPALSAAPLDYTIAIDYVFSPGGTVSEPWGLGSDINDNVYVYSATAPATIFSLASDGSVNWATATGTTCPASTFGPRCSVTPDTLGHLWVADSSGLTELTTAGSVVATYTTINTLDNATVDLGNNVWATAYALGTAGGSQLTPSELEEFPQGQTTSPLVDVEVGGAAVTGSTPLKDPVFDSAGNLWGSSDSVGGALGALLMISNNNSLTAPNFSFSTNSNPAIYQGGVGSHSNSPMIDGSGNMWLGSEDELNQIASSGAETVGNFDSNPTGNYAGSFTLEYGGPSGSGNWETGDERFSAMDGDGKIIVNAAAGSQGYVSVYYPNAVSDGQGGTGEGGANVYLNPCSVQSGTTCTLVGDGGSIIMNAARMSAVDASGAIWATLSSGKNVVQIIGPGAPTWSQRSWVPAVLAPNLGGGTTSLRPF